MSTNKIVKNLKNKDEDFEWYPTTRKMLVKVANLISKIERGYRRNYGYDDFKILDIGAGNGSVFEYIDKIINNPKNEEHKFTFSKFAIEKSTLLIDLMPEDITILGTEFEEQTLIDKPMSVIFSNPPYSNYEDWFYKIAKEGNANDIFLLVPDRWKESKYNFEELIDQRNMTFDILDSFSFMDSDLRKARANVELIHIHPQEEIHQGETYRRKIVEPFDIFFNDTFNFDKFKKFKETKVIDKNENINLVQAGDIVKVLADNYNEDMKNLMDIFHRLSELPPDVISYIADTSINTLKGQLKEKIEGLKHSYWRKLLDQFKPISSRLLTKEKDKIFDKLAKEQYIDFTEKTSTL